jgi:hypothetical protein
MLLKNSLSANNQNFPASLARWSENYVGHIINLISNRRPS